MNVIQVRWTSVIAQSKSHFYLWWIFIIWHQHVLLFFYIYHKVEHICWWYALSSLWTLLITMRSHSIYLTFFDPLVYDKMYYLLKKINQMGACRWYYDLCNNREESIRNLLFKWHIIRALFLCYTLEGQAWDLLHLENPSDIILKLLDLHHHQVRSHRKWGNFKRSILGARKISVRQNA